MKKEISSELSKSIRKRASKIVLRKAALSYVKKAEDLKKKLIEEFISHPITKEIAAGPLSSNISGTLMGYGNLFTFIGFEDEYDPIAPILLLFDKIEIKLNSTSENNFLYIRNFPIPDDIWEATPMPWQEGRSWAKGIESGISGLNYFLYLRNFSSQSRSGYGLQGNGKSKSYSRYVPTQYISNLLKKYNTKFKSLAKKDSSTFIFYETSI